MQIIKHPNHENKTRRNFQHNLLFGLSLGMSGLVIFGLPLSGLIPAEAIRAGIGFWGPVVIGLGLAGIGIELGRRAWLYYVKQNIQKRVIHILAQTLDDKYMYLRNLTLGTRNLDNGGVLLGPHGALVLQVCSYKGFYVCEGDTWYRYKPRQRKQKRDNLELETMGRKLAESPNWQVIRAAREVKAWLSVRDLPQVTVQPLVVLVRGSMFLSRRPSCPIIALTDLTNYIKNASLLTIPIQASTFSETIDSEVVKQLVERLQLN